MSAELEDRDISHDKHPAVSELSDDLRDSHLHSTEHLPESHIRTSGGFVLSFDPYNYTTGRWLEDDALECSARYINFNFAELCNKVVELCPGASGVADCEKNEGGFNRVFLFTMDNGGRIVAKLPTPASGPERLTTASEVATVAYVQSKTTIPIPKILAWSDDETNPIGAEYIIMEHAAGVLLSPRWDEMNIVQHVEFVQNASDLVKQLATLDFPAYGSLYFEHAPIESAREIDIGGGFCLGPHCGSMYWNSYPGDQPIYAPRSPDSNGPCLDLKQYCDRLIESARSRIPDIDTPVPIDSHDHGTPAEHLKFLDDNTQVMMALITEPVIQDTAKPMLLHPDFNKRNIFVSETDPTQITAVIDWQGASIEPAFICANDTPDFCARRRGKDGRIIWEDDEPEPPTTDEEATSREDIRRCAEVFELLTVPVMNYARRLNRNLLLPFHDCNRSWMSGLVPCRHDLIQLSQLWEEFGLPGPACPYIPSEEELEADAKQYEEYQHRGSARRKILGLFGVVASDSWMPSEFYEEVKEECDRLYAKWMAQYAPALGEAEARSLWPVDPPEKVEGQA